MTDLTLESTDDLIAELERRSESYVFCGAGLPDMKDEGSSAWWSGEETVILWLLETTKQKLLQRAWDKDQHD